MRLFANANYDFLGSRRLAYILTLAVILPGLVLLAIRGLNYSVEFTGGTLVQVKSTSDKPIDVGAVRDALTAQGVDNAEIQTFGTERELVVRARAGKEGADANDTQQVTSAAVTRALDQTLGTGQYTIERTDVVGPKVGGELRQKAFMAIILSLLAVLVYLAFRFEWRFGVAAVVATAHDVVASLAFISIANLEVSLFVVAGLLTIVGYSLNDTIVIFDRIREELHRSKREDFMALLNRAINETLPRTFFTGTTALGSLVALSVLGGDVVRPFALLMLFGVIVGTFSSVFIASPVLLEIERRWPGASVRGHRSGTQKAAGSGTSTRKAQPVG